MEMERIEGAFYRFEIYNHLFRRKQGNARHQVEDQIEAFFCAFSAWENEQLAVVHEFLAGLVRPGTLFSPSGNDGGLTLDETVFNDLAEHDVLWGSNSIEPAIDSSSEFIQAILARGLPALHRLTRAKTYAEKMKVLYTKHPSYFTKFLYRGLETYMLTHESGEAGGKEYHHDNDPGPQEALKWAQRGLCLNLNTTTTGTEDPVFWKELSEVRSWAYVFWDQKRLNHWGVLTSEFEPKAETEAERWAATLFDADIQSSIARRKDIHVAGGSGYWSAEDESRIVWKSGKGSPLDGPLKRAQCQLCFRDVICAPHRLVLRLPEERNGDGDEGRAELNREFKALDNIGAVSPTLDDFRLSQIPAGLQVPSSRVSFLGAGSVRSESLNLLGEWRSNGRLLGAPSLTGARFRLSQYTAISDTSSPLGTGSGQLGF